MGSTQGFAKETGGGTIRVGRKHKFEIITLGIDYPIKISAYFLDLTRTQQGKALKIVITILI